MATVWAHSKNVSGRRHSLRDHLLSTAELARSFAEPFGGGHLAYAIGLLHDAGKLAPEWQNRLLSLEAGTKAPAVIQRSPNDHKWLGAGMVRRCALQLGQAAILGHHGGMPDVSAAILPREEDVNAAARAAYLQIVPEATEFLDAKPALPDSWKAAGRADLSVAEFQARMVFSTLVDADFLDTSAHFNDAAVIAGPHVAFAQLAADFEQRRAAAIARRLGAPVDAARSAVYEQSVSAAALPPGVFRLSAPTGAGKTLAAAGFALHHAAAHGLRRVVLAVPFLTITEQNAAVYRDLIGSEFVIEHHSSIEPEQRARYGVENWDAPFVVTTTVQLFDSLFSNRPSKARKLHRLAGAVIVLDEVQAIPPRVLPVILDGLRVLVEQFGATVLLASATQPAWDALDAWRDRVEVRELVPDPPALYAQLNRVDTTWVTCADLDEVVGLVAAHRQALLVVNSTSDSRVLARALRDRLPDPGRVTHLSTRMCPAHRREVLRRVRRRLEQHDPVTLVSTQLIEAGVDVDFPVVVRAMAPAESLLQAAGRANREGRRARGAVIIVDCPELSSLQEYRTGIAATIAEFRHRGSDLSDPDAMRRYYEALYQALSPDTQASNRELISLRQHWQFAEVAQRFRMIDDLSIAVVVRFDADADAQLDELGRVQSRGGTPSAPQLRALQPYTVALPARLLVDPSYAASTEQVVDGVRVWTGAYDDMVGVTVDQTADTIW